MKIGIFEIFVFALFKSIFLIFHVTKLLNLLKNIFYYDIRSFRVMTALRDYDFLNHLLIGFFYWFDNFFWMLAWNDFIVERINKNDRNNRFKFIFGKINLKRSEILTFFLILKYFFESALNKLKCNFCEKMGYWHFIQCNIFGNVLKTTEWTVSYNTLYVLG